MLWLWPSRLVAEVGAPGDYRVKVRWAPYWRASSGCVSKTKDGMVRLHARNAGLVELKFGLDVHRGLQTLAGLSPQQRCDP